MLKLYFQNFEPANPTEGLNNIQPEQFSAFNTNADSYLRIDEI